MMDSFTAAVAMFSAVELKAKQKEAQYEYLRYFRVFCAARGCIVKGSVQVATIGQSMA